MHDNFSISLAKPIMPAVEWNRWRRVKISLEPPIQAHSEGIIEHEKKFLMKMPSPKHGKPLYIYGSL